MWDVSTSGSYRWTKASKKACRVSGLLEYIGVTYGQIIE